MRKSVAAVSLLSAMLYGTTAYHSALAQVRAAQAPETTESAVTRVAAALAYGASHTDAASLASAVRVLDALGARPADEQVPNMARTWEAAVYQGQAIPPPYRGRILGPAYRAGQVSAGGVATTEQVFMGGQPASFAVAPIKGAKLSMKVRDAGGATLCQSVMSASTATCRWTPPFATRARIEISNQGAETARYYLAME